MQDWCYSITIQNTSRHSSRRRKGTLLALFIVLALIENIQMAVVLPPSVTGLILSACNCKWKSNSLTTISARCLGSRPGSAEDNHETSPPSSTGPAPAHCHGAACTPPTRTPANIFIMSHLGKTLLSINYNSQKLSKISIKRHITHNPVKKCQCQCVLSELQITKYCRCYYLPIHIMPQFYMKSTKESKRLALH